MNGIVKEMIEKTKSAMTAVVSNPENCELQTFLYHYEELAGCIFVQSVEVPTLSETTAVLVRGFNECNEQAPHPLQVRCTRASFQMEYA